MHLPHHQPARSPRATQTLLILVLLALAPASQVMARGACCFDDGTCAEYYHQGECEHSGGTWQGDGTTCTEDLCPERSGACCQDDGVCTIDRPTNCRNMGGTYQGDDTTCHPDPCDDPPAPGACCLGPHCEVMSDTECAAQGGVYHGDNTTCYDVECDPHGACCLPDGTCHHDQQRYCQDAGGTWHGRDTDCRDVDCPQPDGRCCFEDGSCQVMEDIPCAEAGGDWEMFADCDGDPCALPSGACCFRDGTCELLTSYECEQAEGVTWMGPDSTCDECGWAACCFPDGTCQMASGAQCWALGGEFNRDDDCESVQCVISDEMLTCSTEATIDFSGYVVDREILIPETTPATKVRFTLKGGDGGYAEVYDLNDPVYYCFTDGAKGARVTADFEIGTGPGQLEPGGTLRFIVGGAGEDARSWWWTFGDWGGYFQIGGTAGGGGAGSAVLYLPPGGLPTGPCEDWTILAVAGGGGGAHQGVFGVCVNGDSGGAGKTDLSGNGGDGGGTGGGAGGTDGTGGYASPFGTAGGGYLLPGQGNGGGRSGCPFGGHGDHEGVFAYGGWGFGGGGGSSFVAGIGLSAGGGGGGGGYSGGGAGGFGSGGGGGGSYVNEEYAVFYTLGVDSTNEAYGSIQYSCNCTAAPVGDDCADPADAGWAAWDPSDDYPGDNLGLGIFRHAQILVCTENATSEDGGSPDVWYSAVNDTDVPIFVLTEVVSSNFPVSVQFYSGCDGGESSSRIPPGEPFLIRISGQNADAWGKADINFVFRGGYEG